VAIAASMALYACASGPASVSGEIRRAGLFAVAGKIIRDEPRLPQGKIFRPTRIQFVDETREVPAILGTTFGFEYVVSSSPWRPFARVRVVIANPPITNPTTGVTFSHSEFTFSAPNNRVIRAVYSFDEAWELAPGTWTISVFHEGNLLLSEQFNVISP